MVLDEPGEILDTPLQKKFQNVAIESSMNQSEKLTAARCVGIVRTMNELQILSKSDLQEILTFSRTRADKSDPFAEWSASWRQESLEHYLQIGWSMVRRESGTGRILGYILAQPFLFLRRQTQSVWIEHIEGETEAIVTELLETIIGVSREKHMQRVLIGIDANRIDLGLGEVIRERKGRMIEDDILEFPTTKS